MRLDSLALFAHLLQEGFDRYLKLMPEQIDECVVGCEDLACGSRGRSQATVGRWRFQSVGFDLNLGRFISVGAQSRDYAVHVIPLLGRSLKLHSHPKFRMRDQYDASGLHFEVGRLNRKDDTRAPRKGRACREIATAEAEVAEAATHGRVVLLGLRKMAA